MKLSRCFTTKHCDETLTAYDASFLHDSRVGTLSALCQWQTRQVNDIDVPKGAILHSMRKGMWWGMALTLQPLIACIAMTQGCYLLMRRSVSHQVIHSAMQCAGMTCKCSEIRNQGTISGHMR